MGLLTRIDQRLARWKGERGDAGEKAGGGSDTGAILLQAVAAAFIAATLVLGVMRFTSLGTPEVVVFDVIKYANAQRAVASKFLVDHEAITEAAPLLLDLSRRTRQTITAVAGPHTLVVIRQAVVQGELRDITDEVLLELGLPTDVPTADPSRLVIDIAPTVLGAGPRIQVPARPEERHEDLLP